MIPIEQTLVTFPMALALGLVFGMGACTIACLPYLGPVFLASDGGIRRSWRILLPFSVGRLSGYASLATLAGIAGHYLEGAITDDTQVRAIVGGATILIGIALWLRGPGVTACSKDSRSSIATVPVEQIGTPASQDNVPRPLLPGGLFLLGIGMTLTPCAPLGAVLFSAAAVASPWHGLMLGLGFGVGAIIIPSLIYGIGAAYLGSRLREQLQHRQLIIIRLSAGLLILSGIGNLWR
ncbi:MAG: sulfite exporter TauE/SafE family protein [Candidatus Thiodiazotropha sp. 6PLUC2]